MMKILLWGVLGSSLWASELSLENYVDQVKEKNSSFKGLMISSDSKNDRLGEAALMFKPTFFFNADYYDDQRPTNAPSFQGSQTIRQSLRAGISQAFRTGTKASLSYNYYRTNIIGASPVVLPNNKFIDVAPTLEFSQSLWRNFAGSEFRAQEELQQAQLEAQKYADQFVAKQIIMQAENSYWRLYLAQQALKVQKESLARAKKLRDWSASRVKNSLADETDLLQADVNVQNREMELQDTITELESAQRDFNILREQDGDVNLSAYIAKNDRYLASLKVPIKSGIREDVLAKLASQKITTASSTLGAERNRPNLELFGTLSINGRNKAFDDAVDQSMTFTKPFTVFGLRFTAPLDFTSVKAYKRSYAAEAAAGNMQYERKIYEADKEWDALAQRFNNVKKRLVLSQKLEQGQERKLAAEKKKYDQGRSTIFQILQFEQDFANTQLLSLRNERELIALYNQLKLYSGVANATK